LVTNLKQTFELTNSRTKKNDKSGIATSGFSQLRFAHLYKQFSYSKTKLFIRKTKNKL